MDNSLILTHLPKIISYHDALQFIREQKEPPSPSTIAEALQTKGISHAEIWKTLEKAEQEAEQTVKILSKTKIFTTHFWSMHYPHALRFLDRPPWNLFYIGEFPKPIRTLSIVGSRKPNAYGIEVMRSIIPNLKINPLQIVSGLALGIDSLAHYYACEAGIPNFAILAGGLDKIYPSENLKLAKRILDQGGGLLSEFPPGTQVFPSLFPWRNRIVAGLSTILWIVQGSIKSGCNHTLHYALNLGKTVAATPADIFNDLSWLPNRILKDGAQSILEASDLDLLLDKEPDIITH